MYSRQLKKKLKKTVIFMRILYLVSCMTGHPAGVTLQYKKFEWFCFGILREEDHYRLGKTKTELWYS